MAAFPSVFVSAARFAGGIVTIPSGLLLNFLIKTEGPLTVYFSFMTFPLVAAFLSAIFLENLMKYPFVAGAAAAVVGFGAQCVIGIPAALIVYTVASAVIRHEKIGWILRDLVRVLMTFTVIAFPMLLFAAYLAAGMLGLHVPEQLSRNSLGAAMSFLSAIIGFPFMRHSPIAAGIAMLANIALIATFIDAWRKFYRKSNGDGVLNLAEDRSPKEMRFMAFMSAAGAAGILIGSYLIYEPYRPGYRDAAADVTETASWYSEIKKRYVYSVSYAFTAEETGRRIEWHSSDCSSNLHYFAATRKTLPVHYSDAGNVYQIDYARLHGVGRSWTGNGGVGLGMLSAGIGLLILGIGYFADAVRRKFSAKAP